MGIFCLKERDRESCVDLTWNEETKWFLDGKSLVMLEATNKWFNNIVMEEVVWRFACLRDLQVYALCFMLQLLKLTNQPCLRQLDLRKGLVCGVMKLFSSLLTTMCDAGSPVRVSRFCSASNVSYSLQIELVSVGFLAYPCPLLTFDPSEATPIMYSDSE